MFISFEIVSITNTKNQKRKISHLHTLAQHKIEEREKITLKLSILNQFISQSIAIDII